MKPVIIQIDLSGVNCYLIKQNEQFVLCDCGGHLVLDKEFNNRKETLLNALKEQGCTKENLKLIILTHGDNDHVANAVFLRKNFNVPIALHKEDVSLVKNPILADVMNSFNYRTVLMKIIAKIMNKGIQKVMQHALEEFESFTPDLLLEDGDLLNEYGIEAQVFHLPGHTPGSIGIITSNNELICGDIFQNMDKPQMAINAMDFKQLKESIKKIRDIHITNVYPGHGKMFAMEKDIIRKCLNS